MRVITISAFWFRETIELSLIVEKYILNVDANDTLPFPMSGYKIFLNECPVFDQLSLTGNR